MSSWFSANQVGVPVPGDRARFRSAAEALARWDDEHEAIDRAHRCGRSPQSRRLRTRMRRISTGPTAAAVSCCNPSCCPAVPRDGVRRMIRFDSAACCDSDPVSAPFCTEGCLVVHGVGPGCDVRGRAIALVALRLVRDGACSGSRSRPTNSTSRTHSRISRVGASHARRRHDTRGRRLRSGAPMLEG